MNEFLYKILKKYPDFLVGFVFICLLDPDPYSEYVPGSRYRYVKNITNVKK